MIDSPLNIIPNSRNIALKIDQRDRALKKIGKSGTLPKLKPFQRASAVDYLVRLLPVLIVYSNHIK